MNLIESSLYPSFHALRHEMIKNRFSKSKGDWAEGTLAYHLSLLVLRIQKEHPLLPLHIADGI